MWGQQCKIQLIKCWSRIGFNTRLATQTYASYFFVCLATNMHDYTADINVRVSLLKKLRWILPWSQIIGKRDHGKIPIIIQNQNRNVWPRQERLLKHWRNRTHQLPSHMKALHQSNNLRITCKKIRIWNYRPGNCALIWDPGVIAEYLAKRGWVWRPYSLVLIRREMPKLSPMYHAVVVTLSVQFMHLGKFNTNRNAKNKLNWF